jgi:hypothetical protein
MHQYITPDQSKDLGNAMQNTNRKVEDVPLFKAVMGLRRLKCDEAKYE